MDDLAFLVNNFKEMSAYWETVGQNLKIPQYKLDQINISPENPSKKCLIKILQMWANRVAREATWGKLHDAAMKVGKQIAVDKINQKHNLEDKGNTIYIISYKFFTTLYMLY